MSFIFWWIFYGWSFFLLFHTHTLLLYRTNSHRRHVIVSLVYSLVFHSYMAHNAVAATAKPQLAKNEMESASAWTHNNEDALEVCRDSRRNAAANDRDDTYRCTTVEHLSLVNQWTRAKPNDWKAAAAATMATASHYIVKVTDHFEFKQNKFFCSPFVFGLCVLCITYTRFYMGAQRSRNGDGALKSLQIQVECWKFSFFRFFFAAVVAVM